MITTLPCPLHRHNPFRRIWIPIKHQIPKSFITWASFILLLISAQYTSIASCSRTSAKDQILSHTQNQDQGFYQTQEAMKVHPLPKKRNNITIQYYVNNNNINGNSNQGSLSSGGSHKKLRRLPHIFNRVLELPFRSDADVSVEENPDCFRFVAGTENIGEVRAHAIEIHPGVTKVVIRPNGDLEFSSLGDLELDMWRFRLPASTVPELSSAVLMDGELIVTVPKREVEEMNDNDEEFRGGMGNNNNNNARLVLVQ